MNELVVRSICNIAPRLIESCSPRAAWWGWAFTDSGQLFMSTLLGAVVGAVVAGLIQFFISGAEFRRNVRLSASEHRRVRRAQAADQVRHNKTIALTIGVKAMTLTNQMYSVMGLILSSVADATAAGLTGPVIAEKMVPMSGISRVPLEFSSDEVAFLFWSNEAELANKILLLNEKNRSLTDAIHSYSESRLAFPEVLSSGTPDLIGIRQRELRDLADGVCQALQEDFRYVLTIMEELPQAFDRAFKQEHFFKADIPGGGHDRLAKLTEVLHAHNIPVLD